MLCEQCPLPILYMQRPAANSVQKMLVYTVIFILHGPFQDCEVTTNPHFELQGMADDGVQPHM